MAKRSVSTNLYNVLVKGTKDGAIKWSRVIADSDIDFSTNSPTGGLLTLTYGQVEEPSVNVVKTKDNFGKVIERTVEDDGYRWVVTNEDNQFTIILNLKQKVLARSVIESIDGTSEEALTVKADSLANDFATAFGISFDDESDDIDSDEEE